MTEYEKVTLAQAAQAQIDARQRAEPPRETPIKKLDEYAQETIACALVYEMPGVPQQIIEARAEGLIAITKENDVPLEQLLRWIHFRCADKEWSLAEYRAWCAIFLRMQDPERYDA